MSQAIATEDASARPGARFDLDKLMLQRAPFRVIDSVASYTAEQIVCHKQIAPEDSYLQGHFPGDPIVPGVILIEMAAQAAQILTSLLSHFPEASPTRGMLVKVSDFMFYAPVRPGDGVEVMVKFESRLNGFQDGKAMLRNATTGKRIAKGKLTIFIPENRGVDRE